MLPPEKTQSLPASSRESSTEPMDTDDARRASELIYRRIRQQAGLSRSGFSGRYNTPACPFRDNGHKESWSSEGGRPSGFRQDRLK